MEDKLFSDKEIEGIKEENYNLKLKKTVRFKKYDIGENYIFPPTTDEYIPKTHIARLISLIVDRMDITDIVETYKGGGASAYNPRMMLKVWLLGIVYKIYTSRPLETALHEHLAFIWISGSQTPDFRSLNNFRLRLKDEIKKIFKQIVTFGFELGIIEGKDVFVDHTKVEANANKHKIVWRKQVERQLEKIDNELEELFEHIEKLNEEENEKYGAAGINDIKVKSFDTEKIDEMINGLNNEIKKKRKSGMDTQTEKDSKKNFAGQKNFLKENQITN